MSHAVTVSFLFFPVLFFLFSFSLFSILLFPFLFFPVLFFPFLFFPFLFFPFLFNCGPEQLQPTEALQMKCLTYGKGGAKPSPKGGVGTSKKVTTTVVVWRCKIAVKKRCVQSVGNGFNSLCLVRLLYLPRSVPMAQGGSLGPFWPWTTMPCPSLGPSMMLPSLRQSLPYSTTS